MSRALQNPATTMRWFWTSRAVCASIIALLFGNVGGCAGGMAGRHAELPKRLSVPQIAALARATVVVVRTQDSLGTGFVVARGVIATNLHVIAGARQILIDRPQKDGSSVRFIVGLDPAHDLVLLFVGDVMDVEPLKLGNDALVRSGDPVVAVGTPQGLELSASTGIVSSVRNVEDDLTLLQITAPISPGSSGGPVFDDRGQVIGVTTMSSSDGQNLNFAIPARYIAALLRAREAPMTLAAFAQRTWSKSRLSEAPEPAPERPKFPAVVAGYPLGGSRVAARAACPGRLREGSNYAECSALGVKLPFASGAVRLYFSKGRLIGVGLSATSFAEARDVLIDKYGKPDRSFAVTPDERLGRVPQTLEWQLEGGQIVVRAEQARRAEVNYVASVWTESDNY
jgi:Trypsin-like peptidase domain